MMRRDAARPRRVRERAAGAAFLAPFAILLIVFQYLPMGLLIRDATHKFTLGAPDSAEYVGLDNFVRVVTDSEIRQAALVTTVFVVAVLVLVVPAALFLAVFLNRKMVGGSLTRTVVFLPCVTSTVVVATMFAFVLSDGGLVNSALDRVGLPTVGFLTDSRFALLSVTFMTAWQQVGLASVLFLGGLQEIPEAVYEAARLDGASTKRVVWSITVPLLSRSTMLVTVVTTVFAVQAFAPAFLITKGGPSGSTDLVTYLIYRMAFLLQQPGVAAAVSIVVMIVLALITLIQGRLLRSRWSY